MNQYEYVKGNSVLYTDPTGEFVPVAAALIVLALTIPSVNDLAKSNYYGMKALQLRAYGYDEAACEAQAKSRAYTDAGTEYSRRNLAEGFDTNAPLKNRMFAFALVGAELIPQTKGKAAVGRKVLSKVDDVAKGIRETVDFVVGVEARAFGKVVGNGTVHVRPTINAIESGALKPRNVSGYLNKEGHALLNGKPAGYWKEYHLLEFGSKSPLRILRGGQGEYFLSPDHYKSIILLNH